MAFFKRNSSVRTAPAPTVVEKKGVFGSKKVVTNENDGRVGSHGASASTGSHLFSGHETLTSAHSKLKAAVAAEKAADAALIKSRELVKIARLEITKLEREAKEEAKIAKAHMLTASKFRKEGDKLGRH